MHFRNATPHKLTISAMHGNMMILEIDIPAPRLTVYKEYLPAITTQHYDMMEISIVRSTMGSPVGLPDEEKGVILIVSALVAEHPSLATRTDLAYPGEAIRDTEGKIIAANGLCAGPGLAKLLQNN